MPVGAGGLSRGDGVLRTVTYELFARAFELRVGFGHVTLLAGLGSVEPPADAQPLPAVLRLAHDDREIE